MTPALLRAADDLRRIEPSWWDLWRRVPNASPFLSPAWLIAWWAVFAPGDLFTVAIVEGDRLVALAPLYREDGPAGRRLLPVGISLSDELDVLVDPQAPGAGAALLDALAATTEQWDSWSAEELPPGAALLAQAPPAGWRWAVQPQSASPVLGLAGGLDAAIPAAKRRKWRMAGHRTARRDASIEPVAAATLGDHLDALFRLHGARWQAKGQIGVLADADVREFHRLAAPALLHAGLLRSWLLRIDGEVAGVYSGFHHRARAFAYIGGFEPAFAFESPGTVLLGAALDAAVAEGATAFHFLRGQEAYKYAWGATDTWTSRCTIEPRR